MVHGRAQHIGNGYSNFFKKNPMLNVKVKRMFYFLGPNSTSTLDRSGVKVELVFCFFEAH
jgi:hypothetical protein